MVKRLRDDERGVAMIVALLVSFVVLLLSIYVVDLSIHNSTSSAYDRTRVQSIASAEAGVNAFWSIMATTPPEELPCNTPIIGREDPVAGALTVSPGTTRYSVQATYFDASGQPVDCTTLSQDQPPAAVLVTATGLTNDRTPRKLEAYMQLTEVRSGGFEAAIIADNGLTIDNKMTLSGPYQVNADIFVNHGDLVLNGNVLISGNVYVHEGSAAVGGGAQINGNLWSWDEARLDHPAWVLQDLQSSQSFLGALSGSGGSVAQCATAGTTITDIVVGGTHVDGTPCVNEDAPTAVHPPMQPLPNVCWPGDPFTGCQAVDLTGYTVVSPPTAGCTAARTFLTTQVFNVPTAVEISGCPNLVFSNSDKIRYNADLIVFSHDGGFTMENKTDWCGSNTCTNGGTVRNLELLVGYDPSHTCTEAEGTGYNISMGQNNNFWNSHVVLYTQCTIFAANNGKLEPQASFEGQILGGTVDVDNNFAMRWVPVIIPGVSPISGFDQDVVYLREVR
ncbi:MAG: hypothetical protein ACE14W_00365 [Candidatus Velamenicoccus archaeovorus]